MKKRNRRMLYTFGFIGIALLLTSCGGSAPIVFGGPEATAPVGLYDLLLVYPISWLIDKLQLLTGNGGIAIAVATILINIIVAPLEIRSQVETKKQQEIQPQMQALQEKYPNSKTDKVEQQKMMMEQQRIYEQNGMSMTGMCMPMIMMMAIQMPLLTAMFGAVRRLTILQESSFNMFGVTYVFGLPDPGLPYIPTIGPFLKVFVITAIIALFATSFLQLPKDQRSPKNQQAMTMYMMNLVFIPILWNQPIALAIYWIVSNLTRLVIRQLFVNKLVEREHEKFKKERREKRMK